MEHDTDARSTQLVECELRLSSLPDLEHRLERALDENARLRRDLDDASREIQVLTHSTSWRLTAPLRRVARGIRMRRP
jgi:hypothetical protein